MVKWIIWWYLTVYWYTSLSLVSILFVQYSNGCDYDDYEVFHICYLCIRMISLPFYSVIFLSYLIGKWCNGQMITYGGSMIVQQFWQQIFFISFFKLNLSRICPLGNFLWGVYDKFLSIGTTLESQIFPEEVPGLWGNYIILTTIIYTILIHIWFVIMWKGV